VLKERRVTELDEGNVERKGWQEVGSKGSR